MSVKYRLWLRATGLVAACMAATAGAGHHVEARQGAREPQIRTGQDTVVHSVVFDSIDVRGYPAIKASVRIYAGGLAVRGLLASDLHVQFEGTPVNGVRLIQEPPPRFPPIVIVAPLHGVTGAVRAELRTALADVRYRWGPTPITIAAVGDTLAEGDWALSVPTDGSGRPADADSTWRPLSLTEALADLAGRIAPGVTLALLAYDAPQVATCDVGCLRQVSQVLRQRKAPFVLVFSDSISSRRNAARRTVLPGMRRIVAQAGNLSALAAELSGPQVDRYALEVSVAMPPDNAPRYLRVALARDFGSTAMSAVNDSIQIMSSPVGVGRLGMPDVTEADWQFVALLAVGSVLLAGGFGLVVVVRRRSK